MRKTGERDGAGHARTRGAASGRRSAIQRLRIGRIAPAAAVATLGLLLAGPALAMAEPAKEPKPVNTAAPTLTGTPKLGQTLTCSTGTWANNPTAYTYAWLREGTPIAGQTGSTYVVQSADVGHSISCQVTAGNAGGEYTIMGLPSGAYEVEFYAGEGVNYLFQYYNGRLTEKEANPVAVTAPNLTSGIDAALSAGGQISGKVTAASGGAALANIYVCAEEATTDRQECSFTNAGGEYTISSLPSGAYNVSFFPDEFEFFSGEAGNYLSQSVGGVSVTAGKATSGIDAALPPGGQIEGTVSGPHGGDEMEVCAYEAVSEDFVTCALTNAGGEYTISGLESGKYKVGFFRDDEVNYLPQYYNDKASLEDGEAVTVTAGGSPTTGIDAVMSEGGEITGKATAASGGAALADVGVCAYEAASGDYDGCGYTNAGGEYTISGLANGKYKVGFFQDEEGSNYLPQYYDDKASQEEGEEVVVTVGSPATGIDAALSEGGQITGKTTAASGGAALANASVCAVDTTTHYEGCASTNAGGEYTISRLSTGTYNVTFNEREEGTNYLPQSDNGVSVVAGSTSSASAALPPGGEITGRVTAAAGGAALANIEVCAYKSQGFGCATTNGGGGSTSAASSALKVTTTEITLTKTTFNAKTNELDFFFQFAEPGTLSWSLVFKNADIGFAASLGQLADFAQPAAAGAPADAGVALAEAAKKKKKGKKGKKCGKGEIKHKGKCVRTLVPFASGSQSVAAGTVEIQVHPDAKARKALEAGRTLHVSGRFTFQSTLGGSPVTEEVSTVAHGHKHRGNKKSKKKKH
jgi:uncharacterized protein (DUF2141 family)